MSRVILFATALLIILAGSPLMADDIPADTVAASTPLTPEFSGQVAPTLFKLGMALLLIVALIYISIMMLKKLSNGKMGKQGLTGTIEVVDRHHLSPKKQLCLIKIENKHFLIGVTEQAVNLVADVSDQEFKKQGAVSKPEYQGFSFKRFFSEARLNLPMLSGQVKNPHKSQV